MINKYSVAVIGVGKVGLPLAVRLADLGHTVRVFDVNYKLMAQLFDRKNPFPHEPGISPEKLTPCKTTQEAVCDVDAVFLVPPTPEQVDRNNNTYLSNEFVARALDEIEPNLKKETIISIVSTLDPRKVDEVTFARKNMRFVYNPPLIRLGRVKQDLEEAKVVFVGGEDKEAVDTVAEIYQFDENKQKIIRGDILSVACAKLAINASLSSRIAWANDLQVKCEKLGANSEIVFDAVRGDPRIGSLYMTSGSIPAGPCLPRDMEVWANISSQGITTAINEWHTSVFSSLIQKAVMWVKNQSKEMSVPPKICVAGISYNPGGLDLTNSIGLAVARTLSKNYSVKVFDPAMSFFKDQLKHDSFEMSQTLEDALTGTDLALIGCLWPEVKNHNITVPVLNLDWRK